MQPLTEMALMRAPSGVFTRSEVAAWAGGSPDRHFGLLKRALASGEIVRIHRGLYCLSPRHLAQPIDTLALAQRVHGPSYVSLETALAEHGLIPEAVRAITSVTLCRAREFDTPLGCFSFVRVPQRILYAGVQRVAGTGSGAYLLASPLKALADYVYVHKRDWDSAKPLRSSLRIDEEDVAGLRASAFDELLKNYPSRRIVRFLEGLREDVSR